MAKVKSKRDRKRVSARRRADTHKTGFDRTTLDTPEGASYFSLTKSGTKRIDILPYKVGDGNPFADEGDLHFERTYFVHRGIGAENNSYVCPAKTAHKPCPICEKRSKLQRDPDSDEDLIKDLGPKERQLFNIIDLSETDKGVQIWDISFYLFGKILDSEIRNADEDEDYEYFADLQEGQTLKIGVAEQSFAGRTFYQVETIGFKPRRTPYDEDILEQVHNLDEILIIPDYDELKAIFLQTDSEEEEEEKPRPKKKKRPVKEERPSSKERKRPAEDIGIKKGMTVTHDEYGTCEVVKVSGDGTSLTLEDEDGDIQKAIGVDEVTIVEENDEDTVSKPKKPVNKTKPVKKEEEDDDDEEDWDDWDNDEDDD